MARDNIDYSHGDSGTEPPSDHDFQNNQRPDAQNFDWFWSTVINRINGIISEFNRIDSDDDGKVDAADQADNADTVDGLHADALADAGHDHNHDELTNVGLSDHHSRYTDSEAVAAVNGETSLTVDITGDADTVDGQNYSDIQNWVNNNADVPNADYADHAGTASTAYTVNGQNYSDIQNWVNNNADVPNADHADHADTAGDADTVDGNHASAFADVGHNHDSNKSYINGYQSNTLSGVDGGTLANCWETIEVNSGDFTIVDNNTIEVNEAGVYSVDYTCSFHRPSGNDRAIMHARVLINGEGNFPHTGTRCYIRRSDRNGDRNSASNHSMHSLNAGDTIEVRVNRLGESYGHDLTEASCTVQKIS